MTADDDVMFQGKWIDVFGDGSYLITDELRDQIIANPPDPGTLFGKPVIMDERERIKDSINCSFARIHSCTTPDTREHPGNCHNGSTSAAQVVKALAAEASQQCPMTKATMIVLGLTRNGACPPIRNPKKAKKP